MQTIKVISIKSVFGKPQREKIDSKKDRLFSLDYGSKDIIQIIGVASGVFNKSTAIGDFIGLRGQFQATNLETGEVYRSPKCLIDNETTDQVVERLSMLDNVAVEFGYVVGMMANKVKPGYLFPTRTILEAHKNDPIAAIEAKIKGGAKVKTKSGLDQRQLRQTKGIKKKASKKKATAKPRKKKVARPIMVPKRQPVKV